MDDEPEAPADAAGLVRGMGTVFAVWAAALLGARLACHWGGAGTMAAGGGFLVLALLTVRVRR